MEISPDILKSMLHLIQFSDPCTLISESCINIASTTGTYVSLYLNEARIMGIYLAIIENVVRKTSAVGPL